MKNTQNKKLLKESVDIDPLFSDLIDEYKIYWNANDDVIKKIELTSKEGTFLITKKLSSGKLQTSETNKVGAILKILYPKMIVDGSDKDINELISQLKLLSNKQYDRYEVIVSDDLTHWYKKAYHDGGVTSCVVWDGRADSGQTDKILSGLDAQDDIKIAVVIDKDNNDKPIARALLWTNVEGTGGRPYLDCIYYSEYNGNSVLKNWVEKNNYESWNNLHGQSLFYHFHKPTKDIKMLPYMDTFTYGWSEVDDFVICSNFNDIEDTNSNYEFDDPNGTKLYGKQCEDCGTTKYSLSYWKTAYGTLICSDCYGSDYGACDKCGDIYYADELSDDGERFLCQDCEESLKEEFFEGYEQNPILNESVNVDTKIQSILYKYGYKIPEDSDIKSIDIHEEQGFLRVRENENGKIKIYKTAKIGRVLKVLFPDIDVVGSQEVQKMISEIKQLTMVRDWYIEVYDDIIHWYKELDANGVESCVMWGGRCSSLLGDMASHKDIKIAVMFDRDDVPIGRALLWTKLWSKNKLLNAPYLDRTYPGDDLHIHTRFGIWAKEQGYYFRDSMSYSDDSTVNGEKLEMSYDMGKYVTVMPYMDTFKYGYHDDMGNFIISNNYNDEEINLEDSDGTYIDGDDNDDDYTECWSCGKSFDLENEGIILDYNDKPICEECMDDYFQNCYKCDILYERKAMLEFDDEKYCPKCYDKVSDKVEESFSSPIPDKIYEDLINFYINKLK